MHNTQPRASQIQIKTWLRHAIFIWYTLLLNPLQGNCKDFWNIGIC